MVPGTVREQITLYDRRITEKQVQAAARLTGLEDSITSLENGYDTVCTPEIFSQGAMAIVIHRQGSSCRTIDSVAG